MNLSFKTKLGGEQVEDYRTLIDSTELQQKVIDYIYSNEFDEMVDSTVFKDNNQCKSAIIHGMAIAIMLTCRCKPFCIKFKKEVDVEDNRSQCYKDHGFSVVRNALITWIKLKGRRNSGSR